MITPVSELPQRLASRLMEDAGGRPLPGQAAQNRMASRPGRPPTGRARLADAGVLILLYPVDGRAHIVLTQRTDTVAHHRSQVSFPGGRQEGRETPVEAALREAHEELGIDPAEVRLVGPLSPLAVAVSGFVIHPVVGWAAARPDFKADPREVAQTIEVSLETLASPHASKREMWSIEGVQREVPFFEVNGHKVWGATAMILSELLAILEEI